MEGAIGALYEGDVLISEETNLKINFSASEYTSVRFIATTHRRSR